MKKNTGLLMLFVFLCLTVGSLTQAAALPGLTMGDFTFTPSLFFSSLYCWQYTVGVVSDGVSVQKIRANFSLIRKSDVPVEIYWRLDGENSSAMTREAYAEITLTGIRITAGMLKSPMISITPSGDLIETIYYPGLVRLQFGDELGLKVWNQVKEFLWQVAVVNGNGVQWKDDDRQKDALGMVGYCPEWGTFRAYYSHAIGPGEREREIFGVQVMGTYPFGLAPAKKTFPFGLMLRGSYLYRTDFLPDLPDTPQKAWYALAVQPLSKHFEVLVQYDWIDDASTETGRWTGGADVLLSENIKVKMNYWQNATGPEEHGAAIALCLRFY